MIDKIEAMIERGTQLRGELNWLEKADPFDSDQRTVRPSKYYNRVADLRPMGLEAMLHVDQKRYHTSKIELLETGKKGMAQIQDTIERIVDADPNKLRLGRVDLAVDVKDVSVLWFYQHAFINFKQFHCGHRKDDGEDECTEMGKKAIETLYFGKRPCCVRIYNKAQECLNRFELAKRRANRQARKDYAEYKKAMELKGQHNRAWADVGSRAQTKSTMPDLFVWPQFMTEREWLARELPQVDSSSDFAFGANAQPDLISGASRAAEPLHFPVLTRVENQMGGRVPGNLYTMGELRTNVLEFNPFERMTLVKGRIIPPGLYDKTPDGKHYRFPLPTWAFYQWVHENWDVYGAARMRQILNRDRHGKVYLRKLAEAGFVPYREDDSPGISEAELYDRYRDSTSWQLAA